MAPLIARISDLPRMQRAKPIEDIRVNKDVWVWFLLKGNRPYLTLPAIQLLKTGRTSQSILTIVLFRNKQRTPVKHKSSSAVPNVKHSEAMWNNMKQCGAMWNNAMLRTVKQCEATWSGAGQGWVCRVGSKGDQAAQMDRSKKVLPVCQPHHYTRTLNSNSQIYHFPSQNCAHFAPTLNSNFRICCFHIWAYHTYQLHPTNRLLQQNVSLFFSKVGDDVKKGRTDHKKAH